MKSLIFAPIIILLAACDMAYAQGGSI